MSLQKWKNPFYALLIPVGAAFCVTAFAYGFMAFQEVNAVGGLREKHASHQLFEWLRTHGTTALIAELVLLAVLTIGAIGTDDLWTASDPNSIEDERPR